MRPRPCSTQARTTDDGGAEVGSKGPRDTEVGPIDRLGHRRERIKLSAEKPRRKQSKRNGCFEWPEFSRLQHLDNEFGSKFSGSLETKIHWIA